MMELFWLLLPVAAASGWWMAKREYAEQADPSSSSTEYFKGLNYLLDDKPDQAIEVFTRMVEVERDTTETHLALGNLFRRRGEVDRAIRIHRNLVDRSDLTVQQHNRALLELGEDYMRAGLFDRAESLFQDLMEQTDYAAVALIRLVDIYQQEKDWRQAIVYFDRFERLSGQSKKMETAHFCCELAEESLLQADRQEARKFLRQALERDPSCMRASILSGHMAMDEGNYQAAINAFQFVETQDRHYFSEVISPLNQCYAILGQQADFVAYLGKIQSYDHSGHITVALAELLKQQEGDAAALVFLEKELEEHPSFLGLRCLVELKLVRGKEVNRSDLDALYRTSKHMLNSTARYKCNRCGFIGKSIHWSCPSCKSWSSVKPLPDMICKDTI